MNNDLIIAKYGVGFLSKSSYGREVLEKAREKHKIDLLQPSDPLFKVYYGKKVEARDRLTKLNEGRAREMREARAYKI